MTLFVFDRLRETVELGPDSYSAPYARAVRYNSPSGQYIFGGSEYDTCYLVDSTYPPSLVWQDHFELDAYAGDVPPLPPGELFPNGFEPHAVDDEGSVWGKPFIAIGTLVEVPQDTHQPVTQYGWTDNGGNAYGLSLRFLFTFTMPDDTIMIVALPGSIPAYHNKLIHYATKGVNGMTTISTADSGAEDDWYPAWAFQDGNGDIWISGVPQVEGGPIDTMTLWRITDVTGSSAYPELQTFDMPEIDTTGGNPGFTCVAQPRGFFSNGFFVGGWMTFDYIATSTLFRANLTTSAITFVTPTEGVILTDQQIPPNPDHWYVIRDSEKISGDVVYTRAWQEIDQTSLAFGDHWDFDQWNADDLGSQGYHTIENRDAFVGWRIFSESETEQTADLFIYYFGTPDGEGDGVVDDDVNLRVWGYSLDGHDFYVLRLGPSESLIYDLTTKQWASWATPGRENWRAHVGQNWVGMSADTLDRDFGTDVVAGDDASGVLWVLDPTTGRDDRSTTGTDSYDRVVTGGIQVTGRDIIPCNAVTIDVALGNPSQTGATVTLKISDDLGQSWLDCGSRTVSADDFSAVLEWRGLGTISAPGRLFRFTDNGGTVRFGGANLR